MSAYQRNKGADWERQTVRDCETMGLVARRFPQCGEKDQEPDVTIDNGTFSYDCEVKKGKDPPMRPAYEQAKTRCIPGHIPCARVTADGKQHDVAIIGWADFLDLLKNYQPV